MFDLVKLVYYEAIWVEWVLLMLLVPSSGYDGVSSAGVIV